MELSGFEIETSKSATEFEGKTPRNLIIESRRQIAEGLEQQSKEKLERLRIALETEQVNQMIQYHANSLSQSRISFWFSIGAATFGFLVIIITISLVSFAIIDAVAALFFTQSNRARKLMTEFFDKLRTDRQFNESLRLCESIPEKKIQSRLKSQLALFFAGAPADVIFSTNEDQEKIQQLVSLLNKKENV